MATHPSILAWRIPRTEESGGLRDHKEPDTTERLGSVGPDLEFFAVDVITNKGPCLFCRGVSLM